MSEAWIQRFIDQHACLATRRMYACDLRDLVEFLRRRFGSGLLQLAEDQAVAWRGELEARGLKPATISRKLAVARGLFRYLLDIDPPVPGLSARNPFRRVRAARFDRTVGKTPCPSPDEVRKLIATIGTRTALRRRDILMALLMFNQGLRISEVAKLERNCVRVYGELTYLALVGKGGAEIRSVLGAEVAELLDRHLRALHPGQRFVFTRMDAKGADRPMAPRTIRARLKAYVARAGLDPRQIRPHSGRVFFITQSYLKTRDLERVARAVGHRELGTTRRYLRLGTALEDHPAKLINILPGRRSRTGDAK